jgi:hypothetical protein
MRKYCHAIYQDDAKKVCRHCEEDSRCYNTSQHILPKSHTNLFIFFFVLGLHLHFFPILHDTLSKQIYFCRAVLLSKHLTDSQKK